MLKATASDPMDGPPRTNMYILHEINIKTRLFFICLEKFLISLVTSPEKKGTTSSNLWSLEKISSIVPVDVLYLRTTDARTGPRPYARGKASIENKEA